MLIFWLVLLITNIVYDAMMQESDSIRNIYIGKAITRTFISLCLGYMSGKVTIKISQSTENGMQGFSAHFLEMTQVLGIAMLILTVFLGDIWLPVIALGHINGFLLSLYISLNRSPKKISGFQMIWLCIFLKTLTEEERRYISIHETALQSQHTLLTFQEENGDESYLVDEHPDLERILKSNGLLIGKMMQSHPIARQAYANLLRNISNFITEKRDIARWEKYCTFNGRRTPYATYMIDKAKESFMQKWNVNM